MTLSEKIKQRILKFLGLERLGQNPNNDRFTFMGDAEKVIAKKVQENKIWYYGDSNELLNFYTAQDTYGNMENPIYNRNKFEYFWGISAEENHIKRVHSGVPNAIVTTITNIVGTPDISSKDENLNARIDKLTTKTNFKNLLNQKQIPMTLVCGWGAFKPIVDRNISDVPLLEWYDGDNVEFAVEHGIVVGIIYKDYYTYKNKNYVFIETRRIVGGNSKIEYELYRYDKSNQVEKVDLDEVPYFSKLSKDGLEIPNYKKVLGIPSIFFYDQNNTNYGRSIFMGKLDLFDDLDQDLSQASQTSRVSTPVEYFPVDLIERGKNGEARLPKVYNRQFIGSNSYPNGDGELSGEIKTSQPVLNFAQYNDKCMNTLNLILTGILSPATMGMNMAKDDTAMSQREKEKVSLMTRNNIIEREEKFVKETMSILLDLQEWMETGTITLQDYDISVKFDEFASPSFENVGASLIQLLTQGGLSPKRYVEKLYGDSLSDEEKQEEIDYITSRLEQDNLDSNGFDWKDTYGTGFRENTKEQNFNQEQTE